MGTTLVKDVFYRASSQLNDLSPQFTRWKQRELVDACNDGQRALAKYIPSSSARVDAVKLSVGSKQSIERILSANIIPGDGSAAADVNGTYFQTAIRNMGANGLTPGSVIRVIDREILDTGTPDWHVPVAGVYAGARGVIFDPRFPKVFYVWPAVPAGTTWWLEQSMLADPVLIPHAAENTYAWEGVSTTTISIDDKYVDDLLNYIMARAFMKDAEWAANPAMSQNYTTLFVGSINAQVTAVTGVNPNLQSLPFNPNVPAKGAGR
jgi:hypothetical protein